MRTSRPTRITSGPSSRPRWSHDGRTIDYVADDRSMMSIAIRIESRPSASAPKKLFNLAELRAASPSWTSGMLPDGRLIFVVKGEEERDLTHYNVILNWSQRLAHRAATAAD